MCNVIPFRRAPQAHEDLTRAEVLARCKIAAENAGCSRSEVLSVEAAARKLIGFGLLCSVDVIEHCRVIAADVVRTRAQVPA